MQVQEKMERPLHMKTEQAINAVSPLRLILFTDEVLITAPHSTEHWQTHHRVTKTVKHLQTFKA